MTFAFVVSRRPARTLSRPGAPAVGDMWCHLHSGLRGGKEGEKEKKRRRRGGGEEEKSNNPNLKGGEQKQSKKHKNNDDFGKLSKFPEKICR